VQSRAARCVSISLFLFAEALGAPPAETAHLRIMFWNVRNLFDTVNDPRAQDDDFTPAGKEQWTEEKLLAKIKTLAAVIREVDPDIAGLAEVENIAILRRLAAEAGYPHAYLIERGDPRGIDTGILSKTRLDGVENKGPGRGLIHFKMNGVTIGFAHWKSKRGGKNQTEAKRLQSARYAINIPEPVLLVGDFNEGPAEKARQLLENGKFRSIVTGPCSSYFAGRRGNSRSCIDGAYLRAAECFSAEAEIAHPRALMRGGKPDPSISDHLPVLAMLATCPN
jgi:endonuclease/exonuclease/phosphatase family metal-dependent hydrolase